MANQNDPKRKDGNVDMNRDPITGAPGAHPAGTGAGAAVGAAVGGVVGAVGGPVGIAAGAAIGGVAGGLVGKYTAEAVNPTGEIEYWRGEFTNRPYASGRTFDDYEPAYMYGLAAYPRHNTRTWEEVEPELERDWSTKRGNSKLEWKDARHASKDAWNRIADRSKQTTSEVDHEAAERVNDLITFLYDGSKGFQLASENVKNSTFKTGLANFARQRENFIAELKPLVATRGERPDDSGSTMGAVHRGWLNLRNSLTTGDHAILSECERGEDSAVEKYRDLIESAKVTPQFRTVLQRQYDEVKRAHDTVRAWRDSTK